MFLGNVAKFRHLGITFNKSEFNKKKSQTPFGPAPFVFPFAIKKQRLKYTALTFFLLFYIGKKYISCTKGWTANDSVQ
jgi:hypothetical protein